MDEGPTPEVPPPPVGMTRFVRQVSIVSLLTGVSRVLGFIRDWLVLTLFSSGWISDAFIIAETVPNLFRSLLGEGAMSASFIPRFVRAREGEGEASASRLASQVLTLLAAVTGGLVLVGMLACLAAAWWFAPEARHALTFSLTALMLPFMAFACCAALMGGMLQSLKAFSLPAAFSIVLNLMLLAGFGYIWFVLADGDLDNLALAKEMASAPWSAVKDAPAVRGVFVLAWAVVLAGVAQVMIAWPALARRKIRLRPLWSWDHPGVRATLKAMGPMTLGLGLVQVNALADRAIAYTLLPSGAATNLAFGHRMMHLPLALVGIAVASTAFPYFASHAAKGEYVPLWRRLVKTLRLVLLLMLPASLGLAAMADPAVRFFFQPADLRMDHPTVYRLAAAAAGYSLGLAFFAANHLLTRVFYAMGDYVTPVKLAAKMAGLNLVLNLVFIWLPDPYRALDSTYHRPDLVRWGDSALATWTDTDYYRGWGLTEADFPMGGRMGEAGMALATSLAAAVNTIFLWRALARRLRPKTGEAAWREGRKELASSLWPIALDALATGLLAYWYRQSIPYEPELWARFERVAVPIVLGIGTYWIIGGVIPLKEYEEWRLRRKRLKEARRAGARPPDGEA